MVIVADKYCPVCTSVSKYRLTKRTTEYHQCTNCKTLFSNDLDNSGMVGGGFEVERNEQQNNTRIERIASNINIPVHKCRVLDFGCGNGMLLNDLSKAGFEATGFDAYNEKFMQLPLVNSYDVCTMVEVVEHLSGSFVEIDCIHRSLVMGGLLYIETSFVDVADEEGIELDDFPYIEPSVGHSTIFSHHGLDLLLALKGFRPLNHINRHVRMYQKMKKQR